MNYLIPWWKSKPSPLAALAAGKAIITRKLSEGSITKRLEKKLCLKEGSKHCIMTPSGSTALLLGMKALGVEAGDEVIVPNLTWIATANAAHTLGAKIKIANTSSENGVIDVDSIKDLITSKTKLIVPVVLNGNIPDFKRIAEISASYSNSNIKILVDCCQAIGCKIFSRFNKYFDAIAYSFAVTKIITSGQGGAICINDPEIDKNARLIKNNGCNDIRIPLYITSGINLKYSDVLASMLEIHLDNLEKNINKVKKLRQVYRRNLNINGIARLIETPANGYSIYNFLEVQTIRRDEMINIFKNHGIETRIFPGGLSTANHLKQEGLKDSNEFADRMIYLPSGPDQDLNKISKILSQINFD